MVNELGRPTHSSDRSQKLMYTLQIGGDTLSSNSLPSIMKGANPLFLMYSVAIPSTSSCFMLLILRSSARNSIFLDSFEGITCVPDLVKSRSAKMRSL